MLIWYLYSVICVAYILEKSDIRPHTSDISVFCDARTPAIGLLPVFDETGNERDVKYSECVNTFRYTFAARTVDMFRMLSVFACWSLSQL